MKTLIILAHPNFENSLANKTILTKVKEQQKNVTIRNIAELYPNYKIDAKKEQEELLKYDTIVFQYPFFWYNMPAILKHWFDVVFEYQFAYGSEGDKLKGKSFIASFTIGGPKESYKNDGYNTFAIEEFTKNIEQTANLAQMKYIKPIYSHSMIFIEGVYNKKEEVIDRANKHAERLINQIK
jgi:putative NADPH-quinone reductase